MSDLPAGYRTTFGPELNGQPTDRSSGLHVTSLRDVEAKLVTYLDEHGLIPRGMLTAVVAPGGTMKGLYSTHETAKLGKKGERTLLLYAEDDLPYIVKPRFTAAGVDDTDGLIFFLGPRQTDEGPRPLHFPADVPLLEEAIAKVRPALVVIDPLASYIDASLEMNQNNQVRAVLQPLIELAKRTGVAIIVVYHTGKDRGRGAVGSVAFEDACRHVLTAAKDDEDEDVRHLEITKSNIGPTGYGRKFRIVGVPLLIEGEMVEVAKLVDEGRSNKSVHDLLDAKKRRGPDPTKREAAREALAEILCSAHPDSVNADELKKQVAEQVDVSPATVWRAFDEMRQDELVGATPVRDEYGTITEWRWFAKSALLLGRGELRQN